MALMQLLSICYQKTFESAANPHKHWLFTILQLIPTHQFLFNAGQINPKEYMDALQVEPSEFELIKYPERGTCLYRCGNERYLLQVIAPDYKAAIFGKAGGR